MKAAAMAAAAPQPTKRRWSLRRRRKAAPRREAQRGADLGVSGLEPHGGADSVGPDGLGDQEEAVLDGHAAAIQGVGLDGVDGAAGPPFGDAEGPRCREPGRRGRGRRGRSTRGTASMEERNSPGARLVEELVHELGNFGHRDDDEACAMMPTQAARTTSQISSARTRARRAWGAWATASFHGAPRAQRGQPRGPRDGVRLAVLTDGGAMDGTASCNVWVQCIHAAPQRLRRQPIVWAG